jgi:hypothetical protein
VFFVSSELPDAKLYGGKRASVLLYIKLNKELEYIAFREEQCRYLEYSGLAKNIANL